MRTTSRPECQPTRLDLELRRLATAAAPVTAGAHEDRAERFGVSVVGRYTALADAILTEEIFLKQLRLLAAQGFVTLGEARQAARRTYRARRSDSLYSRA